MKSESTPGAARNIQTLLVVEDEILTRFQICAYLRECGFRVIEAVNADEAISVLSEPALTMDLVLSDVDLPGAMDGFALAQWIRRDKPGLPIVLVGSPAHAAQAAAQLCEAGPVIAKPYGPGILRDRIKRLLAKI